MHSIKVCGDVEHPGSFAAVAGGIGSVLERALPTPAATHATVVATDGYRASIPLPILNAGGTLSIEDGGLRLRVLDGDTLCWNVKHVEMLEVSVGKLPDDVPEKPGH